MRVAVIDSSCFSLPYDHCLCEGLIRQGCHVLFVGTPSPYMDWKCPANYECWDYFYKFTNQIVKKSSGKVRVYLKGVEHVWNMQKLVLGLQRWKPDIIHFQWLPLPLVDRWFLPRLRKLAPLILTVHDTQPFHGSPSSRVQLWGLRAAFALFDHFIVHTQYSRNELLALGFPETKISVISHGVFDYYKAIGRNFHKGDADKSSDAKKIVLFFGVIKPYKGLDVLIKAFAQLPVKLREEICLHVVGYPNMPIEPLQQLAKQIRISKQIVWDLRFVPEEEVASVFERASIVVLPYRRIDQSGVLMTALAFGKPVVATKVGGFAEILKDGVHGYLVEPGNKIEELAQALESILSQPELAQQMSKAVEKLAGGELSWDTIAKKTLQVYQDLRREKL